MQRFVKAKGAQMRRCLLSDGFAQEEAVHRHRQVARTVSRIIEGRLPQARLCRRLTQCNLKEGKVIIIRSGHKLRSCVTGLPQKLNLDISIER